MEIIDAITSRWACRAYLDKAVSTEQIQQILDTARWAPSGTNAQPWHVAVVTGETKQRISDSLIQARDDKLPENPDYDFYPAEWVEPYKSRRKDTGLSLYRALEIKKDDPEGRKKAWYNNYRFFGAPVGLLFFVDKDMGKGSWIDMGMFLQNVMLTATDLGLATCPEASLAEYPDRIRTILGIADRQQLVVGMALGYPDTAHPVNNYRLQREAVENFTTWYE